VRGYQHLDRYAELRARVATLREQGEPSTQIAGVLNDEGFAMPRGDAFTGCTVRRLCRQFGLIAGPADPGSAVPGVGESWLSELAVALGVARSVMYRWQRAGYLTARRRTGAQ